MDALVSLCKRRGFIFPSSDIYGGLNGFFDYGPLGVEMKNNIKAAGGAISCTAATTWSASTRPSSITRQRGRPPATSTTSPTRWSTAKSPSSATGRTSCSSLLSRRVEDSASGRSEKQIVGYVPPSKASAPRPNFRRRPRPSSERRRSSGRLAAACRSADFTQATPEEIPLIPSPATGEPGSLTPPRAFQHDVPDLRRRAARRLGRRLPAPGDRPGHLHQFQERRRHRPREGAVRHRADRQGVPQRDQPAQFHLPLARVRADGDRVLHRARRRLAEVPPRLDRRRPRLARQHRPAARAAQRVRPPEGEALALFEGHGRHHVQVPLRRAGSCGASPRAATSTSRSTSSSAASRWSTSTRRRKRNTSRTSSSRRSASTASSSPRSAPATPRTRRRTRRASWRNAPCCASARAWRPSRSPCSRW